MERLRIVTKNHNGHKLRGVGIGNQVWMAPVLNEIKGQYKITTDSEILHYMGVAEQTDHVYKDDILVIPAWADWKDIWNIRIRNIGNTMWGVRYKVRGRHIKTPFKKAVKINMEFYEYEAYQRLFNIKTPFELPRYEPLVRNFMVILGTSNKEKCYYPYWNELEDLIYYLGFRTLRLGEVGGLFLTYEKLIDLFRCSKYFIGVDSGLMHLADVYGLKGFVFWHNTPFAKNAPINMPCYRIDTYPTKELLRRYL